MQIASCFNPYPRNEPAGAPGESTAKGFKQNQLPRLKRPSRTASSSAHGTEAAEVLRGDPASPRHCPSTYRVFSPLTDNTQVSLMRNQPVQLRTVKLFAASVSSTMCASSVTATLRLRCPPSSDELNSLDSRGRRWQRQQFTITTVGMQMGGDDSGSSEAASTAAPAPSPKIIIAHDLLDRRCAPVHRNRRPEHLHRPRFHVLIGYA